MVFTHTFERGTRGQGDVRDVTDEVTRALEGSGLSSGTITVFVVGSTAAITIIEFEPGAVADMNRVFDTLAPRDAHYDHHLRWGDDNGSSHVRAALLGPSLTVPFTAGRVVLGTWQQVVLVEFDTRPRSRQVVVQVIGE